MRFTASPIPVLPAPVILGAGHHGQASLELPNTWLVYPSLLELLQTLFAMTQAVDSSHLQLHVSAELMTLWTNEGRLELANLDWTLFVQPR